MDAKDIRNLQEAYLEVVENQQLDEISKRTLGSYVGKVANANYSKDPRDAKPSPRRKGVKLAMDKISGSRRVKVKATNEQTSIYDIILSHLLDEGYAETPEAAERIMVNMSEEWRDSIVEEFGELDEASRADDTTRANIARYAGKKGISFEPGPRWDASANRGRGAHLSDKQIEKQRRKKLRGDA